MANDEPKSGPLGNRTQKPHHPDGWKTPPRDAQKTSYPRTGGKSDGKAVGKTNDERAARNKANDAGRKKK